MIDLKELGKRIREERRSKGKRRSTQKSIGLDCPL